MMITSPERIRADRQENFTKGKKEWIAFGREYATREFTLLLASILLRRPEWSECINSIADMGDLDLQTAIECIRRGETGDTE